MKSIREIVIIGRGALRLPKNLVRETHDLPFHFLNRYARELDEGLDLVKTPTMYGIVLVIFQCPDSGSDDPHYTKTCKFLEEVHAILPKAGRIVICHQGIKEKETQAIGASFLEINDTDEEYQRCIREALVQIR